MKDDMTTSRAKAKSPAEQMLRARGYRITKADSTILHEVKQCERMFWSNTQLDRQGRRTNKPRVMDTTGNPLVMTASINDKKMKWLRQMDRGL